MTPRWPGIALAALLGAAGSDIGLAQAPAAIPETQQRIATAQRMAPPCLSIAVERATISLPGHELVRAAQARRASATAPADAAQRLAWIAGGRAQALLAVASDERDRFGCTLLDREHVPANGLYLVGRLLESGHAAV